MTSKAEKAKMQQVFGFVKVWSVQKGKTMLLSARLANDARYMEKNGLMIVASPPETEETLLKQNTNGTQ